MSPSEQFETEKVSLVETKAVKTQLCSKPAKQRVSLTIYFA